MTLLPCKCHRATTIEKLTLPPLVSRKERKSGDLEVALVGNPVFSSVVVSTTRVFSFLFVFFF